MNHDPLCPAAGSWWRKCRCELIGAVSDRELDRWLDSEHMERLLSQARAEARERSAQAVEAMSDEDGLHVFIHPSGLTTHVGLFLVRRGDGGRVVFAGEQP